MSNVISIRDHQAQAWEAYMAAKRRADETRDKSDINAAAHAWAVWVSMFVAPEQRDTSMRLAMEIIQ